MRKKLFLSSSFMIFLMILCMYIHHAYAASTITVTASVPASSTDAVVTITSSPSTSTVLHQNDEVTFTVSYRSLLSYSTNFVLEASWQQGLITGSNYVDTFNYVLSSASSTDTGAVPVIDLQNRKITWSFVLVPSASQKTVTFNLKIRPDLPTSNTITVVTSARGQIAGTYTAASNLQFTVQQQILPTDTPTPTPILSNTPVPSITPALTSTPVPASSSTPAPEPTETTSPPTPTNLPPPTPPVEALKLTNVAIDEVTHNHAQFTFTTNTESTYSVKYGTAATNLSLLTQSDLYSTKHRVSLDNLQENTVYFFTILINDRHGKTLRSDIFTFKTARSTASIEIKKDSITLIANNIPLSAQDSDTVIFPYNQPFTVNVAIEKPDLVNEIFVKIKNDNVLGITNTIAPAPIEQAELIEIHPGYFSAEIAAPHTEGTFGLFMEVHTTDNSFFIMKLPYKIFISPPLRIYSSTEHRPVENAVVTLYKYEPSLKRYSAFTSNFAIPYRTNERGELPLILPLGSYLVDIKSPGFTAVQKKFSLTESMFQYPEFEFEPDLSIKAKIEYYSAAFTDSAAYFKSVLRNYYTSQRFADLLIIVIFLAFLFIAITMLSLEAHIGILGLIYLPLRLFKTKLKQLTLRNQFVQITVHEESKHLKLISGVRVFLLNKSNRVVFKGTTSLLGTLTVPQKLLTERGYPYTVRAYRSGFFAYPVTLTAEQTATNHIRLWMSREYVFSSLTSFMHWLLDYAVTLLSNLIVLFILASAALTLYLKGVEVATPFLLASIAVIFVWGIFLKTSWRYTKEE